MTTQGLDHKQDCIRIPPEAPGPFVPVVLRLDPIVQLTDSQIEALSSVNEILRIERNAQGDLELQYLPPSVIGNQTAVICARLGSWTRENGSGVAFDSSVGFTLPNGALRSPDASWVHKSSLAGLTDDQKNGFAPISPDFAIELRSSCDSLSVLRRKMVEYIINGVRLAWLIDAVEFQVYVYRPGAEVETLEAPESVSGEPELPGFTLDLKAIWEPGF